MKKVFVFLIMLSSGYTFSQYQFELKGKVEDLTKKKIYLEIRDNYSLNGYIKIDSGSIDNGVFKFTGKLNKKSEIAYLFFLKDDKADPDKFRFVLDSGSNNINVDIPKVNSKSLFSNTNRPASISNEIYNKQNICMTATLRNMQLKKNLGIKKSLKRLRW